MNAENHQREVQAQSRQVRRPRRQKGRAEESQGERESPLMAATIARMNEAFDRAKNP